MSWLSAFLPDPRQKPESLDDVRAALIDKVWHGTLWVAVFGVPASLTRAFSTGWLPLYSFILFFGLLFIALHSQRRRLSWQGRGLILNLIFWSVGLVALSAIGLLGTGLLWLLVSCMLMGMLYPARFAVFGLLGVVLVMSLVGAGFCSRWLSLPFDANAYIASPTAWLATLLTTLAVVAVVLMAMVSFRENIQDMLGEVQRQRDVIAHQAIHDPLTGLPTLSLAADRLAMALHAAARSQNKVALLFIDLDGFKAANDSFGHEAGDAVLKEVAQRLGQALRVCDTAARIGGDEFLIVLGQLADREAAATVASKLIGTLAAPIDFAGQKIHVGCSIGISLFPDHGDKAAELRRQADAAMYWVKRHGKRSYAFFDPACMGSSSAAGTVAAAGASSGLASA